jgi:hypothetical protein
MCLARRMARGLRRRYLCSNGSYHTSLRLTCLVTISKLSLDGRDRKKSRHIMSGSLSYSLGFAPALTPRLALAANHLAEAISRTKEAIGEGKLSHAEAATGHAEEAQTHLEQAAQ